MSEKAEPFTWLDVDDLRRECAEMEAQEQSILAALEDLESFHDPAKAIQDHHHARNRILFRRIRKKKLADKIEALLPPRTP